MTAPAPTRPPPMAARDRFSEHLVALQLPSVASKATPTAIATPPTIAVTTGPVMWGGGGGGSAAVRASGGGAPVSSRCTLRASARRSITSRASATVQTSQLLDLLATGSAAGAAPSVEKMRPTA